VKSFVVIASLLASSPALAEELATPPPVEAAPMVIEARSERVEHGDHWRLVGGNGVVHVWRPQGYDPDTAGTVIYLHGHRSSADQSWDEFRMAVQFQRSGLNALFVVPDSTADGEEPLHWESLGALRRYVSRETGVALPAGALVVMGHSGAFRNIAAWLDDRTIDALILLDALYSHEDEFKSWITNSKGHQDKRLTLVSRDTRGNALRFMRQIPASVGVKKFPARWDELNKKQKSAQVLNFRSPYDHMGIVTSGVVIPLVLRRCDLQPLGSGRSPSASR
jgi:hypothetical protein